MDILTIIISGIGGIAAGFGIAKTIEKSNISNLIKNAKKEAASILKDANLEAENIKKDKLLQAKEKFLELKSEHEKEILAKDKKLAEVEKRIRDKFLDALCEVIKDETKSINLDFVYGEIKGEGENKKLTPLDGQQRLTTLFLLHWYLATKENKFDEASKKLQKFTYETRVSSREFC